VLAVPFILNLLVDYASLLETRFVLAHVGTTSVARTLVLTILDYIVTTLLWIVPFWLLVATTNHFYGKTVVPFVDLRSVADILLFPFVYGIEYVVMGSIASGQGVPVGHLIGLLSFSTYFTSAVFYIFSSTTIVLRTFDALRSRVVGLLEHYLLQPKEKRRGILYFIAFLLAGASQGCYSLYALLIQLNRR